jgi:3-(3-hydroxy-phenyl)propionate hydroxylase
VVYTFHALIVRPWRRGRLFLLGDAAHQMPPFLGQGMCAGIRDAVNLIWKLDLVLRGSAADALLDSYATERSPHVRAIINAAVGAGNLIQTTDPAVAAMRDQQIAKAGGLPVPREMVPGLVTGILDGSSAGIAGRMVPQPRCSDGARLDERLGPGFSVVSHDDPRAALGTEARAAWQRLGARFVTTDALDAWLAGHDASAVVVRPDRYVYAVVRTPADLERIASDLCAALGTSCA